MHTRTRALLVALMATASLLSAEIVYQDTFTGTSISPVWNTVVGSPVTLNDSNAQLDYSHPAGTVRRFLNYNAGFVTKTGYLRASIANFSGDPSIWIGFVGANPGNNAHYAHATVSGNGTYEIFFNNTAEALDFDNGAGWTGTLAAGTGVWSLDGGTTSATIDIGANLAADSSLFGFGFANFGNPAVFPTSSFSIDAILVADTLTVSGSGNTAPTVTLSSPDDGTTVTVDTSINFTGTAIDREDGDLGSNLAWRSNIDGLIGTGPSVTTSTLSLGTHIITASATDSGSLTGSDSIELRINGGSGDPDALRPNIIVIICDDAGYADFSFMDGLSGTTSVVPTPHLDALASRGITFSRAYVAANCQPTRAALVTGAYQARIGNENVGNNNYQSSEVFEGIPVGTDTIWDRMKEVGYHTGAVGKWHLGQIEDTATQLGNRPQNQGIDQFFGMWHGSRIYTVGAYNNPNGAQQVSMIREALVHPDGSKTDVIQEANADYDGQYITNVFGQYAVDFVRDHHADEAPFFLYVAHPAPHKPWSDDSPDFDDPRIAGLVGYRKQVASMMITMDKEIGRLMDTLEDPNGDGDKADSITNDTLVVFLNDNGGVAGRDPVTNENGTNNGILNGVKGSPHDGGIRVPMIMAGAGIDPSRQDSIYDKPVHGVDILPTAVALAGAHLDPADDHIDGVNLLPFLNGENPDAPHEVLVHRWRGTFAVVKDDWKLVNTNNTNARPDRYRLYNLSSDPREANNLITDPAQSDRVADLLRDLTNHEAFFDKPRYPILARTLASEPLNIFDHFIYRPGVHDDWDGGGAYDGANYEGGVENWLRAGTAETHQMYWSDSFCGAILEFPVHSSDYTANNDMSRKTGMEFMLNKIILSGSFTGSTDRTATIPGNDLLFTRNLTGAGPQIVTNAGSTAEGRFAYHLNLNLILYDDLTFTGDGDAPVTVNGTISDYFAPRGVVKNGASTVTLTAANTFSGDTTVKAGILSVTQANTRNDQSSIRIAAAGATLHLGFAGSDTVRKLFIGGVQQGAGVYEPIGHPGDGVEIPQLTGTGTLTVTADASGYTQWADENAPGQGLHEDHDNDRVPNGIEYFMGESGAAFTPMPIPDHGGSITWPMGPSYDGTYQSGFHVETTSNLVQWAPVPPAAVTVFPGESVSYTLRPSLPAIFARLVVYAD